MKLLRRTAALAAVSLLLASAGIARADEGEGSMGAPLQPILRSGLTAGITGGVGDVHVFPKNGNELVASGGSIGLTVGRALNQRTLVFAVADMLNDSNSVNTQMLLGGGVQYYFSRRIFGRAGIGISRYQRAADNTVTPPTPNVDRWAPGALAGLGVEWLQLHTLALNTQLEWVGATYPSPNNPTGDNLPDLSALNVSLMFGVQWYGL